MLANINNSPAYSPLTNVTDGEHFLYDDRIFVLTPSRKPTEDKVVCTCIAVANQAKLAELGKCFNLSLSLEVYKLKQDQPATFKFA